MGATRSSGRYSGLVVTANPVLYPWKSRTILGRNFSHDPESRSGLIMGDFRWSRRLSEPMGHPVFLKLRLLYLPFSTGRVKLQPRRVRQKLPPKHGAFSLVNFEKTRSSSVPYLAFPPPSD